MGGDPCLILAQVKCHRGMDDAHILAVKGRRIHLLQLGSCLGHQLAGHLAGRGQGHTAGHSGLLAALAQHRSIDHLVALLDLVAGHSVQGQAHVVAVAVGDLQHYVVDSRQVQHVGHGGVVAVLGQLLGDIADRDTAAVRGHALGQRCQCLVKGAELTPFYGLAAAHRQGLGSSKLVVYQLGLSVLQQLHAVIGFHLGGQAAGGLCVYIGKHLIV